MEVRVLVLQIQLWIVLNSMP